MGSRFEIKKQSDQWHFTLIADNEQCILSSEHYKSKSACENGIKSVKKNAKLEDNYERRIAKNGKPYFVLRAGNYEVIGNSQMYSSDDARDNGIDAVKRIALGAPIVESTT